MHEPIRRFFTCWIAITITVSAIACGEPTGRGASAGAVAVSEVGAGAESDLVRIAREDLAGRLGVEADMIEVVRFDEVTWPDGSLGCPRKDMRYKQMLVNGSLIVLRVDGVDYEYHSGGTRPPFYCPNPKPPVPADGGGIDI